MTAERAHALRELEVPQAQPDVRSSAQAVVFMQRHIVRGLTMGAVKG